MTAPPISRRDFLKLLGLAPASLLRLPAQQISSSPPNILIVVFDSLSARHLSLQGYPRHTTPNLARLANKATVFHRHYSAANFTSPGVASLFTGVYSWKHRAFHPGGTIEPAFLDRNLFALMGSQFNTLAYTHNSYVNILFDQVRHYIDDWTPTFKLCLASVDDADIHWRDNYFDNSLAQSLILWRVPSSSFFLSRFNRLRLYYTRLRLDRQYARLYPRGAPNFGLIFVTLEQAMDWIKAQAQQQTQPYLAYIHLMPPHVPYPTRIEFLNRFNDDWSPPAKPTHFFANKPPLPIDQLRQLYDESISYVDAEFGRLVDALEESGALANTVLIFTSDHGEMFERGIWAHETPVLYDEVMHVPLLIWRPGQLTRQDIYTPTSAVDMLPTLLSLASRPIPEWCEGQVLPTFPSANPDPQRTIYVVEAKGNARHTPLRQVTLAMIKGRYKLIYYLGYKGYSGLFEMYDLQEDPEELVDIYPTSPLAAGLRAELQDKLGEVNQPWS